MTKSRADKPITRDDRQYHIHTKAGDLAPLCLLVGDPDRATLIAKEFFNNPRLVGSHRGLKAYTGTYRGVDVSVVTTGMGSPSLCIVLPEAYETGARCFIRVGSCGALMKEAKIGDSIIVDRALRLEGTSRNYAAEDFPAEADTRVVTALKKAAETICPNKYFVGTEATTDCFREGQGRPNSEGVVTDRAQKIHEHVVRQGAFCYSMEAAALFVWCATHHGGIPAGAINAVFANRITNEFGVEGEA